MTNQQQVIKDTIRFESTLAQIVEHMRNGKKFLRTRDRGCPLPTSEAAVPAVSGKS
jgi:hypothetical protein